MDQIGHPIPEDTEMTICYRWQFEIIVINRRGRKYKKHYQLALGTDYGSAKFSMQKTLKKKSWTLERINAVTILEIAFAYYRIEGYPDVPRKKFKKLPLPALPTVL